KSSKANGSKMENGQKAKVTEPNGTKYGQNDDTRSLGKSSQTFNNDCKCYINDGLMENAEANPVTSSLDVRAVPTGGSGTNREIPYVEPEPDFAEFNVQSISGGGGYGAGAEATFKEFQIVPNSYTKNFLYPNEKWGVWEFDFGGGMIGAGGTIKFGEGTVRGLDPWIPISKQMNDMNDMDFEVGYSVISVSNTRDIETMGKKLQYSMIGVGLEAKVRFYTPPGTGVVSSGFNGIVYSSSNSRPATFRDSMRTAASYPNHPISRAFNSRLARMKSSFLP
ncbi:MAG: hypothetical protein ACK5QC_03340, partial [Bacteroidota bacterium]